MFNLWRKSKKKNINNNNLKNDTDDMYDGDDKEKEKEKEKYKEIKKYKIIKIKKEGEKNKGIDYIDIEHVICFDCFEKNKISNVVDISSDYDEDTPNKKYFINFSEGNCFCRICYKKHILLDKNSKDAACCTTSLCTIL